MSQKWSLVCVGWGFLYGSLPVLPRRARLLSQASEIQPIGKGKLSESDIFFGQILKISKFFRKMEKWLQTRLASFPTEVGSPLSWNNFPAHALGLGCWVTSGDVIVRGTKVSSCFQSCPENCPLRETDLPFWPCGQKVSHVECQMAWLFSRPGSIFRSRLKREWVTPFRICLISLICLILLDFSVAQLLSSLYPFMVSL